MTVNHSLPAQLHKLPERFISRRPHIESGWLARFRNDLVKNFPHVKRLLPIAAQESENRLPPTFPRRERPVMSALSNSIILNGLRQKSLSNVLIEAGQSFSICGGC